MTNPQIHTLDDLLVERQRLKTRFDTQKELIKDDFSGLKDSLNPFKRVMKKVGKLTSPDKSLGLLNIGISFAMDLLLRRFVFRKSGWLIKLAIPFLIKNAFSNFAAKKIRTEMPGLKRILATTPEKLP